MRRSGPRAVGGGMGERGTGGPLPTDLPVAAASEFPREPSSATTGPRRRYGRTLAALSEAPDWPADHLDAVLAGHPTTEGPGPRPAGSYPVPGRRPPARAGQRPQRGRLGPRPARRPPAGTILNNLDHPGPDPLGTKLATATPRPDPTDGDAHHDDQRAGGA